MLCYVKDTIDVALEVSVVFSCHGNKDKQKSPAVDSHRSRTTTQKLTMNIVLLLSLTISATLCYGAKLDKESFQSIYDLLPDPSWKQMQCNHYEKGKYADYHKARIVLMLI